MRNPYLEFRIALLGIRPMIWRQIRISADATFWDLHVAIQDAMGWEDSHLHCFRVVDRSTRAEISIGMPDDEDDEFQAGWELKLEDYIDPQFHPIALYEYDFGDGWLHEVVLEDYGNAAGDPLPACTGGERTCPPEDSGGPYLYGQLLEASDPGHPEHEDYSARLGESFDPEDFHPREVTFTDPERRRRELFGPVDLADAPRPGTGAGIDHVLSILKREPAIADLIERLGPAAEDIVRYQPLGHRFKAEREALGLSIKDVAQRLKVAQYRVKAAEGSGINQLQPEVHAAYARLLDLETAVKAWAKANSGTAKRLGIGLSAS